MVKEAGEKAAKQAAILPVRCGKSYGGYACEEIACSGIWQRLRRRKGNRRSCVFPSEEGANRQAARLTLAEEYKERSGGIEALVLGRSHFLDDGFDCPVFVHAYKR